MSAIYCVRCKAKTPTVGGHVVAAPGGRKRMVGKCAKCGTQKSQFMSGSGLRLPGGRIKRKGKGVFDDVMQGINAGTNLLGTLGSLRGGFRGGYGVKRRRGRGFKDVLRQGVDFAKSQAPALVDLAAREGSKRVKNPYAQKLIEFAADQAKKKISGKGGIMTPFGGINW